MDTLEDLEFEVLESNMRLAVGFAVKAIFDPSPIRRMLDQSAPRCYMLLTVDREDKRGRTQSVLEACAQFTTVMTGEKREEVLQAYLGGRSDDLKFYGTESRGINVACAGFERHVGRMLSGIVIETLHGLIEANKLSL